MADSMHDPFADYDAAYVFGALSAADRSAYEAHLSECAPCQEAVASIAGLPGLLSRVPVGQVTDVAVEVAPPSLLPRLLSAASAHRRRLRTGTALGAALLAACVVAVLVVVLRSEQRERPVATGAASTATITVSPSSPTVTQLPMRVVAATDLRATLGIQSVTWGTRFDLRCTYPAADPSPGSGSRSEYDAASYDLVVTTRTGASSIVASWNPVTGKTIHIDGASKITAAAIARVAITDAHGQVLLDLAR